MSLELHLKELEKETIEARDKAIEMDSKNIKLERELFVVQEELESKKADLDYHKRDIEYLKKEIYKLQEISEDLAKDLRKSNDEVKHWYKQNSPTLRTVVSNWLKKIREKVKHATNHIQRFATSIW